MAEDFVPRLLQQYDSLVKDLLDELDDLKVSWINLQSQVSEKKCLDCDKNLLALKSLHSEQGKVKILQELVSLYSNRLKHLQTPNAYGVDTDKNAIMALSKVKLLQAKIHHLEERLNETLKEKQLLRDELLNTKLKYETKIQGFQMHETKRINHIKAAYTEEIEDLKSKLKNKEDTVVEIVKDKIETERAKWESQQNKKSKQYEGFIKSQKVELQSLLIRNQILEKNVAELQSTLTATEIQLDALTDIAKTKYNSKLEENKSNNVCSNKNQNAPEIICSRCRNSNSTVFHENMRKTQSIIEMKCKNLESDKRTMENVMISKAKQYAERIRNLEEVNQNIKNDAAVIENGLQSEIKNLKNQLHEMQEKYDEMNCMLVYLNNQLHQRNKHNEKNSLKTAEKQSSESKHKILTNGAFMNLKNENFDLLNLLCSEREVATKWKNKCKQLASKLETISIKNS